MSDNINTLPYLIKRVATLESALLDMAKVIADLKELLVGNPAAGWLARKEAAKKYRRSVSTLEKAIKRGILVAERRSGRIYIHIDEMSRYMSPDRRTAPLPEFLYEEVRSLDGIHVDSTIYPCPSLKPFAPEGEEYFVAWALTAPSQVVFYFFSQTIEGDAVLLAA